MLLLCSIDHKFRLYRAVFLFQKQKLKIVSESMKLVPFGLVLLGCLQSLATSDLQVVAATVITSRDGNSHHCDLLLVSPSQSVEASMKPTEDTEVNGVLSPMAWVLDFCDIQGLESKLAATRDHVT